MYFFILTASTALPADQRKKDVSPDNTKKTFVYARTILDVSGTLPVLPPKQNTTCCTHTLNGTETDVFSFLEFVVRGRVLEEPPRVERRFFALLKPLGSSSSPAWSKSLEKVNSDPSKYARSPKFRSATSIPRALATPVREVCVCNERTCHQGVCGCVWGGE